MVSLASRSLFAVLLALTACGGPTPYKAAEEENRYGYSEERLDPETWRLRFAGNAVTPREQVEDYLLFRAAEIAKGAEASGFVVLSQDVERKTFYAGNYRPPIFTGLYGRSYFIHGRHRGLFYAQPTAYRPIDRYTAHGTIRLFRGAAPEGLGVPFNAEEVLTTLGPRITRPEVVP